MNFWEKVFKKDPATPAKEQREKDFKIQNLKDSLATKTEWLEQPERQRQAREKGEEVEIEIDEGAVAKVEGEVEEIKRELLGLGVSEEEIEELAK